MRYTTLAILLFLSFSSVVIAEDKRTDNFLLGSTRTDEADQGPVYIKSNTLEVDAIKRVFNYKGAVEIIRGDIQITAEKVTGSYDEKQQLKKIVCEEQVVLTRANGERASANKAVYDVPGEIIRLTEGPELLKGGSILSADLVKIYVAEEKSEAEGNVRVKVIQVPGNNKEVYKPLEAEDFEDQQIDSQG